MASIGLRADVVDFRSFIFVVVVVDFIFHEEDEDENKNGSHNDTPDNDDHGSSKKLRVKGSALFVFFLGRELHASDHSGCGQRCQAIIINSKNTEVVLTSCNQISQEEGFTSSWNHPGRENEYSEHPS